MKKYLEMEIQIVMLCGEDIITESSFHGADDGFGDPNTSEASDWNS